MMIIGHAFDSRLRLNQARRWCITFGLDIRKRQRALAQAVLQQAPALTKELNAKIARLFYAAGERKHDAVGTIDWKIRRQPYRHRAHRMQFLPEAGVELR